jgi:AcrR family transcriptional regulator
MRLCYAMAEAMAEKGYVATSVQDVLERATISRQSFYQLFDSKLDCFMAAFDGAGALLLERLRDLAGLDGEGEAGQGEGGQGGAGQGPAGDPLERFEHAMNGYLEALATEFPFTRLFVVEVYAAGTEAIRRRTDLQAIVADALADLMEIRGEAGRFTCRLIVAATSAMVTPAVAAGDPDGLRAIGPPLIDHVRRLWNTGAFGT